MALPSAYTFSLQTQEEFALVLVCQCCHDQHHREDGLANRYLLTVLETGSLRSRCRRLSSSETSLLLCGWPPSHRVLRWSFVCARTPVSLLVSYSPLLTRTLAAWVRDFPISFFSTHLPLERPISKHSHGLRFWGLTLQHVTFEGTQFSP